MKSKLLCLSFLALLLGTGGQVGKSCNLSSYTLVSFTTTAGPTYTIVTQLCIGYGRTGVVFGADGPTNGSFNLAIFDNAGDAAIQAALVSWAPYSTAMGTAMNTTALPPGPTIFTADPMLGGGQYGSGFGIGDNDNIFWIDPVGCFCLDYTCISSTIDCGNVGQICQNITLVYSGIYPDSIRALGIEGAAPFGGCWPNSDMVINLSALPVVWGDFTGVNQNGGVDLNWDTHQEHNTKDFVVTRARGYTGEFTEVGRLAAKGESSSKQSYSFFDANPLPGVNAYQLQQVDADGQVTESPVIYVNYTAPLGISIEQMYPNPVVDRLNLLLTSDQEQGAELRLMNSGGQVLFKGNLQLLVGANESQLDMSSFGAGIYFLQVKTAAGTLEKKVIKL